MATQSQRDLALEVLQKLRSQGYEALWAGGCVRDYLLKREPKDYDVATNARPEQVQALFDKRRTLAIGAAFGVIGVLNKHHDMVEVATFRSDGAYLDGRHPSSVVFTTAEHDAQRRDFTINGMFYDPLEDRVIDYVGGEADLAAKIIRAIGDPVARFSDDKLRMLRAVRFATTFRFTLEDSTLEAIRAMAANVNTVSAERIGAELTRLLVHSERSRGLELLRDSRLLENVFPEIALMANDSQESWKTMLATLARLQTENLSAAFAALFVDSPLPIDVGEVGRRFRFSNETIELAAWIVRHVPSVAEAASLPWPQIQRILVTEGATELMAVATAALGDDQPGVVRCREYLRLPIEKLNPPPLATGDDLVRHGFQPGPTFARLLTAIRDAQLNGQIQSLTEALDLAERTISEESDPWTKI